MIYIQIAESILPPEEHLSIEKNLLTRAAHQVLSYTDTDPDVDATLVLTDDDQMQQLNRQFRGIDSPTDVLAFPGGETDPDSQAIYLGDVIISYPRALAQAAAGKYGVEAELQLLVVHGMLHLLGYDHDNEDTKAAMWDTQAEILARLGCSIMDPTIRQY